jgi:alpha-aminoadipate/glutamate carrier protein LysW
MKGFFCSQNFFVKTANTILRRNNIMTQCPECEAEVTVQGLMVGEVIFCPDCNAELEVINVERPEVALAPQVEEDWGE